MLLVENRELLDRYRRGERKALETVFSTYSPRLAAFLRGGFSFNSGGHRCRFAGSRSSFDLEDRVHEVFVRAFSERARMGYDGLSAFEGYLIGIARNMVIDEFRRRASALSEFSIDEGPEVAAPEGDDVSEPLIGVAVRTGQPQKDAETAEVLALVGAFKSSLSAREREIFRLRFEEEKEHGVIGQETGLSPSKIKTSEQRIREGFFDFMRRHGYFAGFERARHGWLRALRGA